MKVLLELGGGGGVPLDIGGGGGLFFITQGRWKALFFHLRIGLFFLYKMITVLFCDSAFITLVSNWVRVYLVKI